MIQELFLELCEKPHLVNNMQHPGAYLLTSLKRKIVTQLKKNKKASNLDNILAPLNQASYEDLMIRLQEDEALQLNIEKALSSLSTAQRKVLKLRFYEGRSYEDIAELTNTTKRTVYNQIHEAIKRIRKYVLLSILLASMIA